MPNEKAVKRVVRKSKKVLVTPQPLPPINIEESMKVVLETLEHAKPKKLDCESVDVTTGYKF